MTHPPQLDYGRRRSLLDRIGPRRVIVYATLLAGALAVALAYDPVMLRVRQWRAQRQAAERQRLCMIYTAPADRVVYEEDPARAAALIARDPLYYPVEAFDLATGQRVPSIDQPPVLREEPLWSQYNGAPRGTKRNVLFLHERISRSGGRQMVAVEMSSQLQSMEDGSLGIFRFLSCWPIDSETVEIDGGAPRRILLAADPISADLTQRFSPPFPLRVYAGQPDPHDASRFTIAYELRGHRGLIVGVLGDDSHVVLTPDIGQFERATGVKNYAVWQPQIPEGAATTVPSTLP